MIPITFIQDGSIVMECMMPAVPRIGEQVDLFNLDGDHCPSVTGVVWYVVPNSKAYVHVEIS